MKRIFQYMLLIILLSGTAIIWTNQEESRTYFQEIKRTYIDRPCTKPIEYAIGEVDPKFGISQEQLIVDAKEAEKIWDSASGKNLLEYNANAKLKINMIFDSRQQQTLEAEKLENNLNQLKAEHDSAVAKYNSLSATFNQRLKSYNQDVAEYKDALNDYTKEVQKWNAKGGAPEDVYNDLKKEKEELKDTYDDLEKERKSLNDLAQKTNNVIKDENNIVSTYNTSIGSYREKYGDSREFEKGVYNGEEINIYEYRQPEDLKMTLVHEFGHALGIDHLSDPKSIMYYVMGDQDLENIQLTEQDMAALKDVCMIKQK